LSVYRSNKDIYAQLIDDSKGITLAAASSREAGISEVKDNKVVKAALVGKKIAELAKGAGIDAVVFDRGGYLYHGRVKSLADGAREGGLQF
jgi:large subunit ribosomal protein L18